MPFIKSCLIKINWHNEIWHWFCFDSKYGTFKYNMLKPANSFSNTVGFWIHIIFHVYLTRRYYHYTLKDIDMENIRYCMFTTTRLYWINRFIIILCHLIFTWENKLSLTWKRTTGYVKITVKYFYQQDDLILYLHPRNSMSKLRRNGGGRKK